MSYELRAASCELDDPSHDDAPATSRSRFPTKMLKLAARNSQLAAVPPKAAP
jgi:hypothetical protein